MGDTGQGGEMGEVGTRRTWFPSLPAAPSSAPSPHPLEGKFPVLCPTPVLTLSAVSAHVISHGSDISVTPGTEFPQSVSYALSITHIPQAPFKTRTKARHLCQWFKNEFSLMLDIQLVHMR